MDWGMLALNAPNLTTGNASPEVMQILNQRAYTHIPDNAILRNAAQVAEIRRLLKKMETPLPLQPFNIQLIQGAHFKPGNYIQGSSSNEMHVYAGPFSEKFTPGMLKMVSSSSFEINENVMQWKAQNLLWKAPLQTILDVGRF